jgi:hypothetical protein
LLAKGTAVVEERLVRDAVVRHDVREGEPDRGGALALIDAPAEDLAGVDVLPRNQGRADDATVAPAHEDVEAVAVGVDRLQRMILGVVALLRRHAAAEGIMAVARERDRRARDLAPELARERREAGHDPALRLRNAQQALMAGLGTRMLEAQVVDLEPVPGLGAAVRGLGAPMPARHQRRPGAAACLVRGGEPAAERGL